MLYIKLSLRYSMINQLGCKMKRKKPIQIVETRRQILTRLEPEEFKLVEQARRYTKQTRTEFSAKSMLDRASAILSVESVRSKK